MIQASVRRAPNTCTPPPAHTPMHHHCGADAVPDLPVRSIRAVLLVQVHLHVVGFDATHLKGSKGKGGRRGGRGVKVQGRAPHAGAPACCWFQCHTPEGGKGQEQEMMEGLWMGASASSNLKEEGLPNI